MPSSAPHECLLQGGRGHASDRLCPPKGPAASSGCSRELDVQHSELWSKYESEGFVTAALLATNRSHRAKLTEAISRAKVRERREVLELSPEFETFIHGQCKTAPLVSSSRSIHDRLRAPKLQLRSRATGGPPRVLHFLPPRRHLLAALSLQLPTAARRLGIKMDVLVDSAAASAEGARRLRCEYAAVYTCNCKRLGLSTLGAWLRSSSGAKPHPALRYDAVITWSGFHVRHADMLARFFSPLPPHRADELPTYLGRHNLSEGSKSSIRRLLAGTPSAGSPHLELVAPAGQARSELSRLNRSLTGPAGPCYPCMVKPDCSIGGSAGEGAAQRAIATDFHSLGFHAVRIRSLMDGTSPPTAIRASNDSPITGKASTRAGGPAAAAAAAATAATAAAARLPPLDSAATTCAAQPLIVERLLEGPIIYAEVAVRRGAVFRCSFRASTDERRRVYAVPALLGAREHEACGRVVREVVQALDLRNGVFGLQLVITQPQAQPQSQTQTQQPQPQPHEPQPQPQPQPPHARGRGGASPQCAFLEANLRPHGWPLLHEASVQALLTDEWNYAALALLLALDADDEQLTAVAPRRTGAGAPLRMEVRCREDVPMAERLTHSDSLMLHHLLGVCNVSVFHAAGLRKRKAPLGAPLERSRQDVLEQPS